MPAAQSSAESLPIGILSRTSASQSTTIIVNFHQEAKEPQPDGWKDFDDVIKDHEANPRRARLLAEARKELSETLYTSTPVTLSRLRLKAGLSQAALAVAAASTQPHIALIEKGKSDPGTDLISRIASALGEPIGLTAEAIVNQRRAARHEN